MRLVHAMRDVSHQRFGRILFCTCKKRSDRGMSAVECEAGTKIDGDDGSSRKDCIAIDHTFFSLAFLPPKEMTSSSSLVIAISAFL